jgi:hypothetical protein
MTQWSKARNAYVGLNNVIVSSNPTRGMNICLRLYFCIHVM